MIFTTQCPSCEATFPIDSAKVPDDGVYARCSQCEGVFLVEVPSADAVPATAAAAPAPPAAPVAPTPAVAEPLVESNHFRGVDADNFAAALAEPAAPPPRASAPKVVESEPAPVAAPPAPTPSAPSFGKRDPNERAQRLARVLVSDMIAYHPDKHRKSLDEGTLKPDFEEEIDKSWSEYVGQVGKDMAGSTDYFTDALNEILAKGVKVF